MTDTAKHDSARNKPDSAGQSDSPDYSKSLYLPVTDFPMRGGLPKKEPEILERWAAIDLYRRLREQSTGRPKFVLHDGPPYANGNIHIGHALNKTLKDLVTRSQQMLGKNAPYTPGWDCHGLPIEWKIEEENYRSKGRAKPDLHDSSAMIAFRRECRTYADHWVGIQREEFRRLGIIGDWANPYLTMAFPAEAQIAREIMTFAREGLLYRGSKPVMWSVVEKTSLAEAEIQYEDHVSDTVFAAFPLKSSEAALAGAKIVIWTTTPWTLPANRAIAFSDRIAYGLYRVTQATEENWAKTGSTYILADKLAEDVLKAAKAGAWERVADVPSDVLGNLIVSHPLASLGYTFDVPLLNGDHVTDDAGTGFVHTAPGHGADDFVIWMASNRLLRERGISTTIPTIIDDDSCYTDEAPGFGPADTEGKPKRVITAKGEKGDANNAVIAALTAAGNILARGRLKHQYPHSWRSAKPVIFRNTPQWFIAMDKPFTPAEGMNISTALSPRGTDGLAQAEKSRDYTDNEPDLRTLALEEIRRTQWEPASGENRITGMIANRPDWVVSRQRAWGVPIAVFVKRGTDEILVDEAVNARITEAFERESADAWYAEGAAQRFLGEKFQAGDYDKIDDVLDVWFDSGSTHAFTLEKPENFPDLAGIRRIRDGGGDQIMYLEGSDQHRGWFHSSLLESCGTRGRAPYDIVLTHGFTLDENGRKMSKSLGNTIAPQKIIADAGADILRLWTASVDYAEDQRIGPEILKTVSDNYRKIRNTIRWMLGALSHFDQKDQVALTDMPELERYMVHRLAEVDTAVRSAWAAFDYKKVVALVMPFMTTDCSAFYFDIRKDALYCEAPSSHLRKSALSTIDLICDTALKWLAPVLVFTTDEAWACFRPQGVPSIHLETFRTDLDTGINEALAERWREIRRLRAAVTGALEIARVAKQIGSSLEAAPRLFLTDAHHIALTKDQDFAEICITSAISVIAGEAPPEAFRLADLPGVAVIVDRAQGRKCARSWKISPEVGADPQFPDVTPRDARALRELEALGLWPADDQART